jgi:hypothetical protein
MSARNSARWASLLLVAAAVGTSCGPTHRTAGSPAVLGRVTPRAAVTSRVAPSTDPSPVAGRTTTGPSAESPPSSPGPSRSTRAARSPGPRSQTPAPNPSPKPSPPPKPSPKPSPGSATASPSPNPPGRTPSPSPSPKPSSTPSPEPSPKPAGPDLSAYGGLGTWVDIYDNADVFGPHAFGNPAAWAAKMRRVGVRTVFLEAGSYRHPPVAFPHATARFIRAAHAAGLQVVAWYLPLFRNVAHDFAETMRVLRFRTSDGQGYDGFAMDIEAAIVPPRERIANFLRLSAMVRAAVGPDAALGAIIPSPRGLIRVPTYWPGFPYSQLERYFDVILPMSYFTFREHGAAAVGRYVRDNVEIIRRETGDPNVPIHVIGGIADDMAPDETLAFVRAARSEHVFGASLYEFPRTSAFEWQALRPLR